MGKETKKKKKDRHSADTNTSNHLDQAAPEPVAEPTDGTDQSVGEAPEPIAEVVQSCTVIKEPKYEEPVLTKLILQEFEGDTENGLFHGLGEAKFVGGHAYKGDFKFGKMHGHGVYTWSDNVRYEGDFRENHITGRGTYYWLDGSSYDGDVLNGFRHGSGTFTCPALGLSYTGLWYKGKRHGQGIVYYDEMQQSFYEGEWFANMKHGKGVRRYPSGNVYEGHWYRDLRHGEGVMRWHDRGETYKGEWEYGLQHGTGEHTWFLKRLPGSQYPQRNQYIGQWVKGQRHGIGVFLYANGSKYEGEWVRNYKHGHGVVTFKNGRIFEGTFEKDRMKDHPDFKMDGLRTPDITEIRTHTPDGGAMADGGSIRSVSSTASIANTISPSFTLHIDDILDKFPEERREEENTQVKYCVLRNISLLRKIYAFYASLCKGDHDDNTFVMTRMQFWRFLKDCRINQHEISLIEIDRLLQGVGEKTGDGGHAPNDKLLFLDFTNSLIVIAYHVFKQTMSEQKHVMSACVKQLLESNVCPHACKVKGSFMADVTRATVALQYLDKVYSIYQFIARPVNKYGSSENRELAVTCRAVMKMLREFSLVNEGLTSRKALEILASDDKRVYDGEDCNLEIELTLLEFLECLLGFAEAYVTEEMVQLPPTPVPIRPAPPTVRGPLSTAPAGSEDLATALGAFSKMSHSQTSQVGEEEGEAGDAMPDNSKQNENREHEGAELGNVEKSQELPNDTRRTEASSKLGHYLGTAEDAADNGGAGEMGSRPITRGSLMTSVRSSRYVDYAGDSEEGLENLPQPVKFWAQQLAFFFNRRLFPAFDHAAHVKMFIQEHLL